MKYKTEEERKAARRKQLNEARKRWRERHPDKEREINTRTARKWRKANRERYNASHRAWYHLNKKKEKKDGDTD